MTDKKPTYEELENKNSQLEKENCELKLKVSNSEYKSIEEKLRQSQEKWQNLFQILPIGVSIVDIKNNVTENNPALERILDISSQGLIRGEYRNRKYLRSDNTPMPPEDFPSLRALREQRIIQDIEIGVIKESGKVIWLSVSAAPLSIHHRKTVTVTTDITERKLAEKTLRENEEKFRHIFEDHSAVKLLIDPDTGLIIDANKAAANFYGWSREELKQMNVGQINPISSREISENIKNILSENKIHFEFQHKLKDGSIRDVEVFSSKINIGNKFVLDSIIHDITKRKLAEQELISTKVKAEESEQKLQMIFDNAPIAINITSSSVITYANTSYLNMFGFSNFDEISEIPPFELFVPEKRNQIIENIQNREKGLNVPNCYETECLRKDGTRFHVFMYLAKMFFIDGAATIGFIIDITNNKHLENELIAAKEKAEQSEEKFRSMFSSMQEGVYLHQIIYDKKGKAANYKIIEANPVSEKYLNIKSENAIGKLATELFGTPEAPFLDIYSQVAETGEPVSFEQYFEPMDKHFFISVFSPKKGEFATVFLDITKNKNYEIELIAAKEKAEESETKFKAISNQAIEGITLADLDGKYIFVNPSFCKMTGYSENELLNMYVFDLRAKSQQSIFLENKNKWDGTQFEIILKRKDGTEFISEICGSNVSFNNKYFVLGIVRDITERKHTEEILKENEAKYRFIYDNAIEGMYRTSIDGKSLMANTALVSILGYDSVEQYMKEMNDSAHKVWFNAEQRSEYISLLEKNDILKGYECQMKRRDGTLIWASLNAKMVRDKNGNNLYTEGFIEDITERKYSELLLKERNEEFLQINEELNQTNIELITAKEKAEESDRLKTAFLQNMSHEIRTPMNAIMGFSELMAKNFNNKPKLEQFSEIINQRCNDLLDIINDILDIAKIESGQLSVNPEECDLTSLFAELNLFFKEQQKRIKKQHISFRLQAFCDSLNCVIITDKVKLKQIFINLISNAFKFTESGTIEGGCKLDSNNNLIFYVSDTGIGIEPDKQKIIFERFAQVEQGTSRLYGGTGLGLSIVKGLVNLLGGEILLESEFRKGSTFYFSIPYKISPALQNTSIILEKNKAYSFQNKTILIVEDDFYNAEYFKEILAETGLKILHTAFGEEAIQLSLALPIDLVLMDIRLPDMDGNEATRQIRHHKPLLKIIAQTAYASDADKQNALDAGCNDYISKPTKPDLLLSMISKYL